MPVDGYAHCGQEKYLPVESLEAVMRASSVERAVLCQHLGQYDNSYLASLVESQPDRFAGIALIDHRASSWEEELATVVATGFRGLRITSEALREEAELAPAAAAAGLIPVIYAPEGIRDLVSQLGETAAARPQVPIIVSHLGNPLVDRDRLQHGEELLDLASEPNILVLLSGLHMFCGFPYAPLEGLVAAAVEAFGPARIMWGSNYPVGGESAADYRRELELTLSAAHWGLDRQAAITISDTTARRVWFS